MCISIELDEAFDSAEKINVYNDGALTVYGTGDKAFGDILVGWKAMIDGAHRMPAYGVSLDRETRKALKSGMWVEFEFNQCFECDGLPFEKLLINVEKSFSGFNLVRYKSDAGYDGRCFYYDLVGKDMSNFYNILLNL